MFKKYNSSYNSTNASCMRLLVGGIDGWENKQWKKKIVKVGVRLKFWKNGRKLPKANKKIIFLVLVDYCWKIQIKPIVNFWFLINSLFFNLLIYKIVLKYKQQITLYPKGSFSLWWKLLKEKKTKFILYILIIMVIS